MIYALIDKGTRVQGHDRICKSVAWLFEADGEWPQEEWNPDAEELVRVVTFEP